MTAIQTYLDYYQLKPKSLSKIETLFLESILFDEICNNLIMLIKEYHQPYFRLIHLNKYKESNMIEGQLIRFIINDILSSGEYTLSGIAYYTDTPEDIIYDIATGDNPNPSLLLAKKLLAIHRSIKPDFYRELFYHITHNEKQAA